MCIQTIWLRKVQQEVPCGRCFECVKRRRNDWYIRCLIEGRTSKYVYFGLLTYAEVGEKLVKSDVQKFLKRLRFYGYKFKYLIVGEFGELRGRAHWHCLFFSESPISYKFVSKAWRGGYEKGRINKAGWVSFSVVRSPRALRYCVKYLYKYDGKDPRFTLMVSKNPAIGKGFLNEQNQIFFLREKTTTFSIGGRPQAMPRYYKRKIFDGYEDIKQEVNDKLAAKVAELESKEIKAARSLYPNMSDQEIKQQLNNNKHVYNREYFRTSEERWR